MHEAALDPAVLSWKPTTLRHGDALAFAASDTAVFVSIYDETEGGIYRSLDAGRSWAAASDGLPAGASITALFWHAGRLFAGTVGCGLFASTDGGGRWAAAGSGLPPDTTLFSLAARGDVLFAGTEAAGVFRSADRGSSWTAVNRGLPFGGRGLSIFSLAADARSIFAHHPFGLHRSTDDGASWQAVGTGLPADTALTLLAIHDGQLFVSSPAHLYASADGGTTWTAHSGGIWEGRLVRALVAHGPALFAGTQGTPDSGLYCSTDGGISWRPTNDGLPGQTWSVNLFATRQHLLAGVGEHGVWYGPLAAGTTRPAPAGRSLLPFHLAQNDPNPFYDDTVISYTLSTPAQVRLDVYDLLGKPVVTLVDGWVEAGEHRVLFDAGPLDSGFFFYRLTVGSVSQMRQMLLLR